jgi:hypothetical protein
VTASGDARASRGRALVLRIAIRSPE